MPWSIFEPDTGLKDDYDGTIETCLFTQNDQNNWVAQIVIHADDGEDDIKRFSIGAKSGFQSYDGGETLTGPKPDARFNSNTAYWKWIAACMNAGAKDVMAERSEKLYDGKGPLNASFWVGLRFHFDIVMDHTAQRRNDETGQWEKVAGGVAVLTPTKYLGIGTTQTLMNGQTSLLDEADLVTLKVEAMATETFSQFGQRVMELTDSSGQPMAKNRAIVGKLSQAWWEELRNA